jgi:hypothetical protein
VPGEEDNPVPAPSGGAQTNEREVTNMRQLGPDFYDSMHGKIEPSVTRTRYDGLFRKVVANLRKRLIPLSQVNQNLGLAGQIRNRAGFEFFRRS